MSLALACLSPAPATAAPEPFRFGYLTDASGPMQGTFKATLDGFQLYVDQLNKAGGVKGRPFEIQVRDIQSDTQRSVNAVQELSAADVLAILGLAVSNTHAAVYASAEKLGLPVVAAYPANIPLALPPASPNAFASGLIFSVTGEVAGKLARQVSPKGKTLVCLGFESPGSILACEAATKSAAANGFTKVESIIVPLTQRDFRGVADKVLALNPDVVTDCFGRGHVVSLLPALGAAGYDGVYLNMESGIGIDALRDAVRDAPDIKLFTYSRYIVDGQGPGSQAEALRTAAKAAGVKELLTYHAAGWALGLVVSDAARKCAEPCDRAAFTKALEQVSVDTGGLSGAPITFSPTDHYGATAYRLYQYDHAKKTFAAVGEWLPATSSPAIAKK
ncbi:ABC transporter substrate-binding protein [Xanthobacter pseudotagetidis]|uniref:ABC transporter substrate-binding protein n=1 Tax=Xanthobacter pseudotagetidis TaxID=3119911 RepID=UPI003726DE0E